ncbi:MAG: YbaK/EbsC family protein, partial [Actinomycetota bacterium]|nr:YbaK/EbsC family protein [Actinomycetota bacterium]
TGFVIGGVPPFGHRTQLRCFVDRNICRHETVWGAAGTPDTVFAIPSARLVGLSGGQIADFVM